ncbi:PucR family transcriptional regulator [Streptacidiphilus jiangxiensis]|uniref:Sugar diacid utilization regulator n=1 Tax=Streptacidiphilus jiangxiensis TaxID=235985 RepID=A0A1H7L818_STRJI|nr:helix-turn-helix domain-containing protein [Streptacidiphilus jiangxiensis]SEK95101.1 Sugar diacid utilization regulator [Streptacidiphilus jiangxiensis]
MKHVGSDNIDAGVPLPGPGAAGISLRQLLMSLGEPVVELQCAPAGLDVEAVDVGLLDPEDPPAARPGELVLAIGVRGRAAIPALRAAAAAGAAAVAVRIDSPAQRDTLRDFAEQAGIALLSVRREVRWEHLDALARAALGSGRPALAAEAGAEEGDLFALAQTTAVLTGGIVSIEDTANRILAYSRSADSDEIDDLRRLTILGWQGPEPYLSKLREWGVFQQLRAGDTVVAIDEHPELGLRRRLVVAIRSGERQLGTIWVQEGATPLTERADQALLGAARVAALQLMRRRRSVSSELRLTQNLLSGVLEGTTGAQSLAGHLGLDPKRPAAVLGFALPGSGPGSDELHREETLSLMAVHAAARHRSALTAAVDERVYVLLPELPRGVAPATLLGWARELAEAATRHLSPSGLPSVAVHGALGEVAPTLSGTAASRREADRILDAMVAGHVDAQVADLAQVRAQVLLAETLDLLAAAPSVRDPRLTALLAHDAEHGGQLAPSVLAWLDAFGDVREAAAALHIHPNTLRYRVRRAEQLTSLDLSRPEERVLAMLQLRLPPGA